MKNLEELLQCGEYKNLIASTEVAPMIRRVYLKSGQGVLQYGSVLGLTKDNFGILVDKIATDGSQIPIGILAETIDTEDTEEAESVLAQMYITGVFNKDALLFAEGTAFDDMELELKKLGIYTKKMYE